jgi:glucuronoarabinoxylan endo-1,4-beta-xylanase
MHVIHWFDYDLRTRKSFGSRKDRIMYIDRLKKGIVGFSLALGLMIIGCSKEETPITGPLEAIPNGAIVYLDGTQQVIRGFGGVNMPGWIPDLTPDQVNKAFGTGTGQIGMTILRIRVPYDETQFDLEVPTARLAASLGAIIIASPWTPPPAMKTNNNIVGGRLADASYAAYAAHLEAFADYMSSHGVPLYAVSVQNEPDVTVTYESCYWNASQLLIFVKNNAPAIGVRIIVPESANFDHALSDPILNDPAAAANVAIIGGHIYGEWPTSYPLAASKGKELWMTEHLMLYTDWIGDFNTAAEINDCMNAGMNAYLWWYIRRYYGPIDDSGNVTKRGYVMSQFARFVRPGFIKVSATATPQANVQITAYRNGSKVVIVALNSASSSVNQQFTMWGGTMTLFTPYVTSSSKDCVQGSDIPVSSGTFTATLDPSSVITFVSN